MTDNDLPEPLTDDGHRISLSWVWLMPLAAILISAGVVWQTWRDQGPLIVIAFPTAEGIEAGQTPLRYREVQVGMVEDLRFAPGLGAVEAHVRLDKDIAPYVDGDAQFWLVAPQVSARGVTGLNTVLSGVYIEGVWDEAASGVGHHFVANEAAPLARPGERGTRVVLRPRTGGQLSAGAPVLFNGIEVGQLGEPVLSENGNAVTIEAFIAAPHDTRLTTNTHFWDSSGISLNLGAGGLSVNVESLASLIEGGVSFGTLVTGGAAVNDGHVFDVFGSESQARSDVFEAPSEGSLSVAVLLPANDIRLGVGATVRYQGIKLGEVTDISGYVDPAGPRDAIQMLVQFTIAPGRLGLDADADEEAILEGLRLRVVDGLRVRISSEGILGQTMVLELADLPVVEPLALDLETFGMPLLPDAPANLTDATENLDGLMDRVNNLPIEKLMTSAIDTLDAVTRFVENPELQQVPANANALIGDTRTLISADELPEILANLQNASADFEALAAQITASEGVKTVLAALEQTDAIAEGTSAFVEGLPDLSKNLSDFVGRLESFPLEQLATDTTAATGRLNEVLADPSVAEIAPALATSLTNLDAILADIEQTGLVDDMDAAVAGITTTVADIQVATENLPQIMASIDGVVAEIDAVPFAEITTSLDRVVKRTEEILRAEGIEDLPGSLDSTLTELSAALGELRAGGAVENLNGTLASAEEAFAAFEAVSGQLPALVGRLDRLAAGLGAVAQGYASDSRFYNEMRGAIRDVSGAAEAFRSLARTIERNPNSLLRGR
ncbi:MlaD family protein [Actibacterium lipolyticum]|uniref:Paraquat-inducible protein B n=1 Tax=Actibacterium lipolyticum TaxID=1524263 RepID=A0A238KNU6_9RHOB|nr:MlaD family protein [Actibacterium lipolyticum]SMX44465.1 Paraquat-inducible protein B [Actibacterium lipolyticum]